MQAETIVAREFYETKHGLKIGYVRVVATQAGSREGGGKESDSYCPDEIRGGLVGDSGSLKKTSRLNL